LYGSYGNHGLINESEIEVGFSMKFSHLIVLFITIILIIKHARIKSKRLNNAENMSILERI
jgi:hypothetical protein